MANKTGKALPDATKERRGTAQPSRMNPLQPRYETHLINRLPPGFAALVKTQPPDKARVLRAMYRDRVREYATAGVMQNPDRDAVAAECWATFTFWQAAQDVSENGLTVQRTAGPMPAPSARLAVQLLQQLRGQWTDFGRNPVGRQRLEAAPPPKDAGRFSGVEGQSRGRGSAPARPKAGDKAVERADRGAVIEASKRFAKKPPAKDG